MPSGTFLARLTEGMREETMQIEWTIAELQRILKCMDAVNVQGLGNQQEHLALARKVDAAIKQAQARQAAEAAIEDGKKEQQDSEELGQDKE